MKASVYCIVSNETQADEIVAQLRNAGFSNSQHQFLPTDQSVIISTK